MTEASEMKLTNPASLDAIFRAHYERIARVIGRVIHDQARAEELAVEVFLKWWRNPQAHGEQADGSLYRTAVRVFTDPHRVSDHGRAIPSPSDSQIQPSDGLETRSKFNPTTIRHNSETLGSRPLKAHRRNKSRLQFLHLSERPPIHRLRAGSTIWCPALCPHHPHNPSGCGHRILHHHPEPIPRR
jgi:DNA-directed RNA polymerase specialized sigma24 family protein